ncbi:MAG TPA: hypothetical protein VHG35_00280 [Gemmatimonadales bacterium]|nr:hypothetical protein [Gemmatimonadales bacterium]
MPTEPTPLEPPGEDTYDLPESLGWFVAACTWVRDVVLACREALGRAPRRHGAYGA